LTEASSGILAERPTALSFNVKVLSHKISHLKPSKVSAMLIAGEFR
jgi:hypothetical protein